MVGNNEWENRNHIVGNQQGIIADLVIGNNERLMLVLQEEASIPLTAEQHDFLSYVSDKERKKGELTTKYLFITKLQPTSSNMGIAPVYDTDEISKVSNFDHYYDNEMYNLFTHKEQHPELPESTQGTYVEQQNDNNIMPETRYMDLGGGNVEQHDVNNEETNVYFESLFHNFKFELDKCVMVNRNDKDEIKRLTTMPV
ncbi:hypothetical protein Tco_0516350 [Tanacetum coccineum]